MLLQNWKAHTFWHVEGLVQLHDAVLHEQFCGWIQTGK